MSTPAPGTPAVPPDASVDGRGPGVGGSLAAPDPLTDPQAATTSPTGAGQQPQDDVRLTVGLAALASLQQVTQHGDGKANMLLAVQVGLAALVATRVPELHTAPSRGGLAVAFWVTTLVYVTSFVVSGYFVAQAIRPRRARVPADNTFALPAPGLIVSAVPPRDVAYGDDVWEMARALGEIAARKNWCLSWAVGWGTVMVLSAGAWLALAAPASG